MILLIFILFIGIDIKASVFIEDQIKKMNSFQVINYFPYMTADHKKLVTQNQVEGISAYHIRSVCSI